jgi:Domain of unknown function (DUF4336)
MLHAFGTNLYISEGPPVSFYGFRYPTRMAVAKLSNDSLWVWSPIALTDSLAAAVDDIGPVRHIVSPNKLHHLFLGTWSERWPAARLYAPPDLAKKRPDLRFAAELAESPEPEWAANIDQTIFRGSFALEEVVFFHRPSRTAVIGDLVQRFPDSQISGWKGLLMRLDGLVGKHGSTPREWRASFLRRGPARRAREKVLGWRPERLLIAHGDCAEENATAILASALSWI